VPTDPGADGSWVGQSWTVGGDADAPTDYQPADYQPAAYQPADYQPAAYQPVVDPTTGGPAGPPEPPQDGRRKLTLASHVAIGAAVVATIGVIVAATLFFLSRPGTTQAGQTGQSGISASPTGGPSGTEPSGSPSGSPSDPAGSPTAPGPSPTTGAELPPSIDVSQVADDPLAGDVARTLSAYFDNVDAGNYRAAYTTLTPRYQQRLDYADWLDGISSSSHSGIVVSALNASGSTVQARVSFTSHQAAAKGPRPGETCTNWATTYRLIVAGGATPYLIDGASDIGSQSC
jgi:hypothetical protein